MIFLDSEHVGMGEMLPLKKVISLFLLNAWFLKIILVGDFFVAAIIRYGY